MAKETKKPEGAAPPAGAIATYDWQQSEVSGFEATRQEDLGIPFLSILQSLSPQIKKTDPNYETMKIDGAGEGDIINSLTNTVLYTQGRDPIKFIPCYHERLFVEWKPREAGGGLVKMHRNASILNECRRNERNQDVMKNGNNVVTTSYFYGILLTVDGPQPAVIGMSSTKISHARDWLNQMMAIKLSGPNGRFTPPMFSHIYSLSTTGESNTKGSWYGWNIQVLGQLNDQALIEKAVKMATDSAAQARAGLPPASDKTEVPFV